MEAAAEMREKGANLTGGEMQNEFSDGVLEVGREAGAQDVKGANLRAGEPVLLGSGCAQCARM